MTKRQLICILNDSDKAPIQTENTMQHRIDDKTLQEMWECMASKFLTEDEKNNCSHSYINWLFDPWMIDDWNKNADLSWKSWNDSINKHS